MSVWKCTKCGETKPVSDFYPNKKTPKGHSSWCKVCHAENTSANYQKKKDAINAKRREAGTAKAYYAENKDKMKARMEAWVVENHGSMQAYVFKGQLRRRYGMALEDFQSLMLQQEGRCALCDARFDETEPHVDHDHATGRVRGLLCSSCNRALGYIKESQDWLCRASKYLATGCARVENADSG